MKEFIRDSKIIIKLGTKVVFDSEQKEIRRGILYGLARDIGKLLERGNEIIVVSSGAVGCGRAVIKGNGGIGRKQAQAAVGQIELMKEYSNEFSKFDLHIAQFLLSSEDLSSDKLENIKMAYKYLGKDVIAIINENDVTAIRGLTFGDNDYLSAEMLEKFDFDILLILTDLGALIRKGEVIQKSNKFNVDDYDNLSANDGFGFGGLKSKLDVAKQVVQNNKYCVIGKAGDSVIDILENKKSGTWFKPKFKNKLR